MKELYKTLGYVGVAALVVLVAVGFRYWPRGGPSDEESMVGKPLFEDFTDPLRARSLEISRYDDVTNSVNRFSVNQVDGRWVIPSHANYPADADEQMKDAATSLIGREILDVASDADGDHEMYGVIEPNAEKLKPGAKGVGVMVSMKDNKGEPLAELIIGKQAQGDSNVRFVRVPGQSRVYATEIDLEKLTTKFEDWIEKDLLKINSINIDKITFNDYSMETVVDRRTGQRYVQPNRRMKMMVEKESNEWQLDELTRYDDEGRPVNVQLAAGEVLDTDRIGELTSALDELEIVDVRRKPKGLGADMKADEGIKLDDESYTSLVAHGFIPDTRGQDEGKPIEFFSKNGDLTLETRDGVEYLLRFGDLAVSQDSSEIDQMNRYLMVAARVAEHRFPEPQKPDLPPLPAGPAPPKEDGAAADENSGDENAADENSADESAADENAADDGKSEAGDEASAAGDEDAKDTNAETKDGEDTKSEDAKSEDAKSEDVEQNSDEKSKDDADTDADRVRIEVEREQLMKEYQRELDAWKEQRKVAADKVREQNARFGDWYYVISEDVYKQIHLGRAELIKEGENVAEEGFGVDAFRLLEENGLRKKPAEQPGSQPPSAGFPGIPGL